VTTVLHAGRVSHVRHTPFRHRFGYRLWMLSVDLDQPEQSRLFRRNRAAVVSLHDRDHGPRDGSALRPWVEAQLKAHRLDHCAHRVRLMAIPRVLGYAFNPIAFYLCHDAAGRLGAVIHQQMHVSPFFDMQGGYRFAFSDPAGPEFRLSIRYGTEATPRMTATMRLHPTPLSDASLLRLLLAMPLMPLKVFAAIHWEALRLLWRGARFHPVPKQPGVPA